jgi:hypothetical protein
MFCEVEPGLSEEATEAEAAAGPPSDPAPNEATEDPKSEGSDSGPPQIAVVEVEEARGPADQPRFSTSTPDSRPRASRCGHSPTTDRDGVW